MILVEEASFRLTARISGRWNDNLDFSIVLGAGDGV